MRQLLICYLFMPGMALPAQQFTQLNNSPLSNTPGDSRSVNIIDVNGDGLDDVFISNGLQGGQNNELYLNLGNGIFEAVQNNPIVLDQSPSDGTTFADTDNDGDLDLFVTRESQHINNLFRNNGNGGFVKVSNDPATSEVLSSITASWGDVNNDGLLDLFVGNSGNFSPQNNRLFINNGNGGFTIAAQGPVNTDGGCSFGSAFADYDNDGDLDLFVANGFCSGTSNNFLYQNDGAGGFTRDLTSLPSYLTLCSFGAAWGDLNDDGFPDLVIANCKRNSAAAQPNHSVFLNNNNGNTWLKIKLIGINSNHAAIGAQIRVKAAINGQSVTQLREISAQSGYCGQNSLTAHFGFGTGTQIDSIHIKWPSGLEQQLGIISVNQTITVVEGQASGVHNPVNSALKIQVAPNPIGDSLNWTLVSEKPFRQGRFELMDAQGKVVLSKGVAQLAPGSHVFQSSTTHLPNGIYSLRLISDIGASGAVKVVK